MRRLKKQFAKELKALVESEVAREKERRQRLERVERHRRKVERLEEEKRLLQEPGLSRNASLRGLASTGG